VEKKVELKNEPAPEETKKSEMATSFDSILKASEKNTAANYESSTAAGGLGSLGSLLTAAQLKEDVKQ